MGYVFNYRASFENLSEELKEHLEFLDKSEVEKLQIEINDFLRSSRLKDKVDKGNLVDCSIILFIFNNEVKKLVNKFEVPKNIEDLDDMINIFRFDLWKNLEPHIFNYLELVISDLEENLSPEELNRQIGEAFNYMMPYFFRVFDIQFQLTSLNPNNDPKVISLDLERAKKYKSSVDKFIGKKFKSFEVKAFKKVVQIHKEQKEKGINLSLRKIAIKVAQEDLELIHEREQNNFYKRFTEWNKKTK